MKKIPANQRLRALTIVTSEQAQPAKGQHTKPCRDCPWRRVAVEGWLGPMTGPEWIAFVQSDAQIDCHTLLGAQCAGAAIFRANIGKLPRDRVALRLPRDRERVFASPTEFLDYHDLARITRAIKAGRSR